MHRKVSTKAKKKRKKDAKCYYCGVQLTRENKTKDHRIPRSQGGQGGPNLVACCMRCNNLKRDMPAEVFWSMLEAHVGKEKDTMGCYMNNEDVARMGKMDWLGSVGTRLDEQPMWPPPARMAYVCVVDNGLY